MRERESEIERARGIEVKRGRERVRERERETESCKKIEKKETLIIPRLLKVLTCSYLCFHSNRTPISDMNR